MSTRKLNLSEETKEQLRRRHEIGTHHKGKLMLDIVNPEANLMFGRDYGIDIEDALLFMPVNAVVTKLAKLYKKYDIAMKEDDEAFFNYLDYLK